MSHLSIQQTVPYEMMCLVKGSEVVMGPNVISNEAGVHTACSLQLKRHMGQVHTKSLAEDKNTKRGTVLETPTWSTAVSLTLASGIVAPP